MDLSIVVEEILNSFSPTTTSSSTFDVYTHTNQNETIDNQSSQQNNNNNNNYCYKNRLQLKFQEEVSKIIIKRKANNKTRMYHNHHPDPKQQQQTSSLEEQQKQPQQHKQNTNENSSNIMNYHTNDEDDDNNNNKLDPLHEALILLHQTSSLEEQQKQPQQHQQNPNENSSNTMNYHTNDDDDDDNDTKLDPLHEALILLRIMSKDDWIIFDSNDTNTHELINTMMNDDYDNKNKNHNNKNDNTLQQGITTDADVDNTHNKYYADEHTCDNDNSNDDDDDDDEIASTISIIQSIVKNAQYGKIFLSTYQYNIILANLAISSELPIDDIFDLMMQTYTQMISLSKICNNKTTTYNNDNKLVLIGKNCIPDSITYEILLLCLCRRLHATTTAKKIISDEILLLSSAKKVNDLKYRTSTTASSLSLWTPDLIEVIATICKDDPQRCFEIAKRLVMTISLLIENNDKNDNNEINNNNDNNNAYIDFLSDRQQQRTLSKRVYQSLINVMKVEDASDEAIQILKMAVKASGKRLVDQNIDSIFVEAVHWPTRNRKGIISDNISILQEILDILLSCPDHLENYYRYDYSPGFIVWKQFIVTAAKGAHHNEARWALVSTAIKKMILDYNMWPDNIILMYGIDACSALHNSELVVELISRAIIRSLQSLQEKQQHQDLQISQDSTVLPPPILQLPFHHIMKAMEICISANDIKGCREILSSVDSIRDYVLPSNLRSLCLVGLNAFAKAGYVDLSDKLLSYMAEHGIDLGDECYAAIIEAAGASGDLQQAEKLLESMESGALWEMQPGPVCYEAFLVACMQNEEWDKLLLTYEKIMTMGMIPSQRSVFCQLLATFKTGGRTVSKNFLKNCLLKNNTIGRDVQWLALKIILFGVVTKADVCNTGTATCTVDEIRLYLIDNDKSKPESMKRSSRNLIRSLQIASFEDQRTASTALPLEDIQRRRDVAWRHVLEDLLAYDETKVVIPLDGQKADVEARQVRDNPE